LEREELLELPEERLVPEDREEELELLEERLTLPDDLDELPDGAL